MDVVITVDSQEKRIAEELRKLGCHVREEKLPTADVLIADEIAVERKEANDFIRSIIDGRIFDQIERMKESYPQAVVIVEGRLESNLHPNAVKGAFCSIAIDRGVPVLWSEDEADTAAYIAVIAKRLLKGELPTRLRPEKKRLSLKEQQQFIVESLPGVGPQLAQSLLRKFGSVEKVFGANTNKLQQVEKIGKKKAAEIRRVLSEAYRDG